VAQKYYKKIENYIFIKQQFRGLANPYQENKQNFIYRNGRVTEVGRKIKVGKNKE
jgi:hypothetical protein